jgi:hypothetical protein
VPETLYPEAFWDRGNHAVSRFADEIHDFKGRLSKPDQFEFILHSPLGELTIMRMSYYTGDGCYVAFDCSDQRGNYRYITFSEDLLSMMPMEIRRKKERASVGLYLIEEEDSTSLPDSAEGSGIQPSYVLPSVHSVA